MLKIDCITDHSTADSCCTPALLRECSLQGSLRGQARELTHALVTLSASSIMTTGQVEVRQVPSLYNDSKIAVSMMASPATGILLLPLLLHLRLLRLLLLRLPLPADGCRGSLHQAAVPLLCCSAAQSCRVGMAAAWSPCDTCECTGIGLTHMQRASPLPALCCCRQTDR